MAEDEFDAITLKKAFAGLGCNKPVIIEVFCLRPYKRLVSSR